MGMDENVKINAEMKIDTDAIKSNLKEMLSPIKKFASKASKLLGALSIGALLKEGFESAIETEQVGIRINTILKNRFGLEKSVSEELNRQSAELANRTIFRQKELQAAQETLLLNLKGTEAMGSALEATQLLTTALSGANASSSDLSSNAAKISEALRYGNFQQFENQFSGEIGLSQEQIASLSQFSTEAERANALLAIMKGNFGDTSDAVNSSFAGSMKNTISKFEDMATSIAQNVVPALTGLFDLINSIGDAFGGLENILIGFMLFFLTKFLISFITSSLPALLGMGLAQAFSMGGPPAFFAGLAIAGAIAGTVGAAIGGIMALKGGLGAKKMDSSSTNNSALNNAQNTQNQNVNINVETEVNTDPIDGTVTKIKRVSNVGSSSRY